MPISRKHDPNEPYELGVRTTPTKSVRATKGKKFIVGSWRDTQLSSSPPTWLTNKAIETNNKTHRPNSIIGLIKTAIPLNQTILSIMSVSQSDGERLMVSGSDSRTASTSQGTDSLDANLVRQQSKRRDVPPILAGPAKRTKIHETQYVASVATSELVRLGAQVPRLRKGPRLFPPGCNVDMTCVRLVKSSSVAESPFLTPSLQKDKPLYNDMGLLCLSKSVRSHYGELPKPPPPPQNKVQTAACGKPESSSEWGDSMSSITDPDSSVNSNNGDEDSYAAAVKPTVAFSPMGEALSPTKEARYVVLLA